MSEGRHVAPCDIPGKWAKLRIISKKLPGPLAAAAEIGFGALEYFDAENDADRKQAIGSALGGAAGAALGGAAGAAAGTAVLPGVGTTAGATAGSTVGGILGRDMGSDVARWLTSPVDHIPDSVKGNLFAEVEVVNSMLMSDQLDDDGRADLESHKADLMGKTDTVLREAESTYKIMSVPQTMYLAQLQSDLESAPGLREAVPMLYDKVLSEAASLWGVGGSATPSTPESPWVLSAEAMPSSAVMDNAPMATDAVAESAPTAAISPRRAGQQRGQSVPMPAEPVPVFVASAEDNLPMMSNQEMSDQRELLVTVAVEPAAPAAASPSQDRPARAGAPNQTARSRGASPPMYRWRRLQHRLGQFVAVKLIRLKDRCQSTENSRNERSTSDTVVPAAVAVAGVV